MSYSTFNPCLLGHYALEVSANFRDRREGNLLVSDVPSTVLAAMVSSRKTLIAIAVPTTALRKLKPICFGLTLQPERYPSLL